MNNESVQNPIGIYRNPDTKAEIGCTDPAQADAVVRQNFRLVKQCESIQEVTELLNRKAKTQGEQKDGE